MSGILCLKWNNHTSTFIKTLDNLRSKELYCDATIACQGKYFPVHRFVLTTCSEYFEEIFERTQCKHPFIIVKDIEELQLESLLNYMYKGEVNVLQDRLPGLIRAAEALKVKGLAVPEDDNETKNSIKEKRKSNVSSSPLEPKSKRRLDRNPSERLHHGSKEDDDVIETLSQSSNSSPKTQQKRLRDNLNNSKTKNQEPEFPNTSAYNKGNDTEVEDIKIEPSEIFETVDEDFPIDDAENEVIASQDEDSLFVSLLSPNNAQLPSEEEMIRSEMNSSAIPQCSSWTEDMDKSKETHDDVPGKTHWLESDQLTMDPYSSYMTNEEESTNFSSTSLNESSMLTQSHTSTSESGLNEADPSKSSIPKLQSSEPDNYHLSEISGEVLTEELIPKIKEEIPSLKSLDFGDTSPSAMAVLTKFQFPDCSPNYSSMLTEEMPNFESLPTKLENIPDESFRKYKIMEDGIAQIKFHCTACPFRCKNKTALKLHIMRKHTGEKPYSCAICSYRCTTNEMLKIHNRKHTGERPFSCPYCNCRMTVKSSLKRHILLKHMNAIKVKTTMTFKEPSPAGLSFGVNSFSSSPTTEALLLYKTPYLCPHCNHRTRTKQEILRHISYYHSNFRYTCTLCYYKCRTNSLLKKHMLRHAKEKPYSCPLCSYKTARKQHLVRHSKLHTGEKPFSCTVCSYKAARKDRLRDHLRKHSEIGEFNLV